MKTKVDQSVIKTYNKKQILTLLQKKKEMTKRELAKAINVSLPTIISNVNELIEDGILEEAGVALSTGGRKPIVVRFLKNSRYSIGVDFLIGKIRITLLNINYEIVCDRIFEFDLSYSFDDLIEKVSTETKGMLSAMNISDNHIIGIGFSLPGTVNETKKILEIAANLNVSNINFNKYQDKFNFPIFVENESNTAAYAEYKVGVCQHENDMVFLSVNKGVGAGIIAHNKFYKGYNKRAGELGHMTIYHNGVKCVCNKLGCWNSYISAFALLNNYNNLSHLTIHTLREFFNLYHQNDKFAVHLWNQYIIDMGVGIQNIILIFDPHYIVIGGEMANYADELIEPLKKYVFKNMQFSSEDDVKILPSALKENASVIGAALIPISTFLDVEGIYK